MPAPITSLHNPRVKLAAKLRDRKGRSEQNRIIIDGVREIERARGRLTFEDVFICDELCQSDGARALCQALQEADIPLTSVSLAVFEKLSYGDRQEGVIATAKTPDVRLARLRLPDCPLVAVLEGVEKPGNVGAILRSADGAGVSALLVVDGGTDVYNPNAIRASLGAIFSVPVAAATAQQALDWLREQQIAMFAARVDATQWYHQAALHERAAVILGSEANGLTSVWRAPDITAIKLPMLGIVDSLNVSVTAGVLFYEAQRQRAGKPSAGR